MTWENILVEFKRREFVTKRLNFKYRNFFKIY